MLFMQLQCQTPHVIIQKLNNVEVSIENHFSIDVSNQWIHAIQLHASLLHEEALLWT